MLERHRIARPFGGFFEQLPDRYTNRMRFDRCNRAIIQVPSVSGHECAALEAKGGFASRCP